MSVIDEALQGASAYLSSYFPLPGFIATNPLWDHKHQPFHQALMHANLSQLIAFYSAAYEQGELTDSLLQQAISYYQDKALTQDWTLSNVLAILQQPPVPEKVALLYAQQVGEFEFNYAPIAIKNRCLRFLLSFFGQSNHDADLFVYWRANLRGFEQQQFTDAMSTLSYLLKKLSIPEAVYVQYMQAIFSQLYGWGSLIKWLNQRPGNPWIQHKASLSSLLILWLYEELQLQCKTRQVYQQQNLQCYDLPQRHLAEAASICQYAYDLAYSQKLLAKLDNPAQAKTKVKTPKAQFVFCIDTRSEGLRRHLEQQGDYETFGFAGFFGFAFQLHQHGKTPSLQCPALLNPEELVEVQQTIKTYVEQSIDQQKQLAKAHKKNWLSPYVWFELAGLWLLPVMLYKTLLPSQYQLQKKKRQQRVSQQLVQQLQQAVLEQLPGLVDAAEGFLKTMGLVDHFANDIFVCAHQSTSENNPFAAALDCGACGGNSGVPNAMVAAVVLNDQAIREQLKVRGIDIPARVKFRAACHHTVRDELEIYDQDGLSSPLQQDIDKACRQLRQERLADFPGNRQLAIEVKQKEADWAELLPELGLANNAAMIVAPRWLTQNSNLHRRTFLHSYDPSIDPKGEILHVILSAPVIVAHWINAQYYFSTIDNKQFGAGNKVLHNVIPNIGVMEGNLSDLQIGLPEQSVSYRSQWMHQPHKLQVVLYANPRLVTQLIESNQDLKSLVDGGWLSIINVKPES